MSAEDIVKISNEELFNEKVDSALAHQKALLRQVQPETEAPPLSPWRRLLLSQLFYIPLSGLMGGLATWLILEPYLEDTEEGAAGTPFFLVFPLTGVLVVLLIFAVDSLIKRTLPANIKRILINTGVTMIFTFMSYVPIGLLFYLFGFILIIFITGPIAPADIKTSLEAHRNAVFISSIIIRSIAWTLAGSAIGLGMTITQSTRAQRRAAVMGATIGGALGGLFFDPISRFIMRNEMEGAPSRLVGLCVVGLCIGLFVALSERLGRQGWVRVRTGPLAGKSFILYHNPTIIGSSPQSNIYLFKDSGISASHAAIHHAGGGYEIVDMESGRQTLVNNRPVRNQKLSSGDQIILGATVLDFEERAKQRKVSAANIGGQ
ncbi:MAG TPA: FHA domain-containing protein [Pyrinomonadaceae bacterium]|jgi:hypothetical protein